MLWIEERNSAFCLVFSRIRFSLWSGGGRAAQRLARQGVGARLLSMPVVKPLDEEAVLAAARQTGRIITVEEGTVKGGLGGAVAELVTERCPVPVRRIGVPDEFAPTGSEAWLMDHWGISADGIIAAARELVAGPAA